MKFLIFLFFHLKLIQCEKIAVVGSGNFGTAAARLLGQKSENNSIKMWVFEEIFNGRNLSEIINTDHVNSKYLPNIKLPYNVLAS
jgi:glycerol-3-phosphate dehydrogenase (NAD+)